MNRHWSLSHVFYKGFLSGSIGGLWLAFPAKALTTPADSSENLTQIAQASSDESFTTTTITGQLDANSSTLPNGSYYQAHTFEGTAGEEIVIELSSSEGVVKSRVTL